MWAFLPCSESHRFCLLFSTIGALPREFVQVAIIFKHESVLGLD